MPIARFDIAPAITLLFSLLSLPASAAAVQDAVPLDAAAQDTYTVRVAADLAAVEVRACFAGQPPPYLYRHRDAARFTDSVTVAGRTISSSSRHVSLRGLAKDACVRWQVNLAAAVKDRDYRTALQWEDAIITAGNLWFWRDSKQRDIEVLLYLPAGMQFSAPWMLLDDRNEMRRYRPTATPASWSSRLALGRFATQTLRLPGGRISLAMLGDFDQRQQALVQQWIAEPARAVAAVTGRLPVAQSQVLVVGIGPRSSPVPWAHVLRGGGMAVELFVDETRSLQELRDDWTATHEFSHFLLPYVAPDDRWLSEGLASYYQNVLRARSGRLSELQAWQKLVNGFQRGRNDERSGGIMDTYWRGASLFLQADSQLRQRSAGRQSLDTALAQLHACCADPGQRWSAADLLRQLDRLTGFEVFSELYAKVTRSPGFPDPLPILQKLGVNKHAAALKLDDSAPWSQTRKDIMGVVGGSAVALSAGTDAAPAPDS